MLHVNVRDGFTIAVSEAKHISQVAKRTILSSNALAVLAPILVNIEFFHVFLDLKGIGLGAFLMGLEVFLAWAYRSSFKPVLAMQAVTDGLVRLFGASVPGAKILRNRGMRAVDALGPIKRLLAQPALR